MKEPDTSVWTLQPVGLLALCPLLAVGGTLLTAACVAALFLVSLVLVALTMALLGRSVAPESRILTLLLVSGIWVTLLELGLQAYAFPLSGALGVYVPLLAANSLLLMVGEQSLRGKGAKIAVGEGFRSGLCAALWVVPLGFGREVLGTGMLLSDSHLLPGLGLPDPMIVTNVTAPVLQSAPGALLVLALAAAWVMNRAPAHA